MKQENKLKRRIIKIGFSFLGLMLLLTIVSKSIYRALLPEVTKDKIKHGTIVTKILTNGKLGYDQLTINAMKVPIESGEKGKIITCYVGENQVVKKGQPLLEIAYKIDNDKMSQNQMQLGEIEINKNAYEGLKQVYIEEKRLLEEKLKKKEDELDSEIDDYEIREIEYKIEDKQKDIENNKALYDIGDISKDECDKAEKDLELLLEKKENIVKETKQRREEEIEKIKNEIKELTRDITTQEEKIALENNRLTGMSQIVSEETLISPIDGIVYEVNVAEGAITRDGDSLMLIIPSNIPITMTFMVDEKNIDQIKVNNEIKWNYKEKNYSATVIKKTYKEPESIITCSVEQDIVQEMILDYKTYKNVEIEARELSESYKAIIPTSAIGYEGNNAFIYTLEEIDTIFERKYRVHKQKITILEEGDYECAISGVSSDIEVVVSSTKELADNIEVKLKYTEG